MGHRNSKTAISTNLPNKTQVKNTKFRQSQNIENQQQQQQQSTATIAGTTTTVAIAETNPIRNIVHENSSNASNIIPILNSLGVPIDTLNQQLEAASSNSSSSNSSSLISLHNNNCSTHLIIICKLAKMENGNNDEQQQQQQQTLQTLLAKDDNSNLIDAATVDRIAGSSSERNEEQQIQNASSTDSTQLYKHLFQRHDSDNINATATTSSSCIQEHSNTNNAEKLWPPNYQYPPTSRFNNNNNQNANANALAQISSMSSGSSSSPSSAKSNGSSNNALVKLPVVHSQIDFEHCLVPDLQRITNSSFYWGKMDRYEAERLLEGKPEGTFLLRDSAQEEFLFSVTFRKYGRSLHARIEQNEHKFSFDCHDPCVRTASTVTGLLKQYESPDCLMFFEPKLSVPLHRTNPFSLQQLCRATIVSHTSYDGINKMQLPVRLKGYLKEYHYKQKLRINVLDEPMCAPCK